MPKTLKALAEELERLDSYRSTVNDNIKSDSKVTVKIVGSADIEIEQNQAEFYAGLLKVIEISSRDVKTQMHSIMFPTIAEHPAQ